MNKKIIKTITATVVLTLITYSLIVAEENSSDRVEYYNAVLSLKDIAPSVLVKKPPYLTNNAAKNELQAKIDHIVKAIEHSKESMKNWKGFYCELGKAYYISTLLGLEKNYNKANEYFMEEIKRDPNDYLARILLASDYMHDGRYLDAIEQYEYLRKNNLVEEALKLKAVAELYARQFDVGKKDLQTYLKSHPNDKQCYALIGEINKGKIEESLKEHENALKEAHF